MPFDPKTIGLLSIESAKMITTWFWQIHLKWFNIEVYFILFSKIMLEVKSFESISEVTFSMEKKMWECAFNFPPKKQTWKKGYTWLNNLVFYLKFLISASGKRLNWWRCKEFDRTDSRFPNPKYHDLLKVKTRIF